MLSDSEIREWRDRLIALVVENYQSMDREVLACREDTFVPVVFLI